MARAGDRSCCRGHCRTEQRLVLHEASRSIAPQRLSWCQAGYVIEIVKARSSSGSTPCYRVAGPAAAPPRRADRVFVCGADYRAAHCDRSTKFCSATTWRNRRSIEVLIGRLRTGLRSRKWRRCVNVSWFCSINGRDNRYAAINRRISTICFSFENNSAASTPKKFMSGTGPRKVCGLLRSKGVFTPSKLKSKIRRRQNDTAR